MIGCCLTRYHTTVTTIDVVEAAWADVIVHATQFLYDLMARSKTAVIAVECSCSGY